MVSLPRRRRYRFLLPSPLCARSDQAGGGPRAGLQPASGPGGPRAGCRPALGPPPPWSLRAQGGEGRRNRYRGEIDTGITRPSSTLHRAFFIKTTLQMISACSECPLTIVLLFILPMNMIEKVRGCIWR